jgi:cytochrome c oxidase cbb3-type subunit 4
MTYEHIQSIAALTGLLIFVALFAFVLVYVFWPGNQKGFEEASRIPLEKDDFTFGGRNGR